MAISSYAPLDQAEEDALHKPRLLNVEDKPFKRITKRLLAPDSLIAKVPQLPPTPPPDASAADEAAAAHEAEKQAQLNLRRQWREDMQLDFSAFESSIIRIQFLLTSNIKERERYAAEKLKIEATAQAVKDNTAGLRVQLEDAQKQLSSRKEFDELAEEITSNRALRPRVDQHVALAKLNEEIAELERESQGYTQTWVERRQQFNKILDEGMEMRRQIKAEKEEVERREGMEGIEEGEEGESSIRGRSSGAGTPAPGHEGGATPMRVGGTEEKDSAGRSLAVGGLNAKREKSPLRISQPVEGEPETKSTAEENEDADMAEDGEVEPEDDDITAAPPEGLIADDDEKEEGEEDDVPSEQAAKEGDSMDIS